MNIIVRESSSEMRAIARHSLRGNWKKVTLAMAIFYFLLFSLPLIFDQLIPSAAITVTDPVTEELITQPVISNLYTAILTGPFQFGLISFGIFYFRRKVTHPGHLFDGFEHFVKAFFLTLLIGVYVFLWSILFVIPGLIAAYRYSQAFYILADHPELSVRECIHLSKTYMAGNKLKLLSFELSFIGWAILASLTVIPLYFIPLNGIAYIIMDFILAIPNFFYMAYNTIGRVVFYELVSGNLMAKPDPSDPFFREQEEMHI